MWRLFALLLFIVSAALASNIKLYLKDGNFHLVREYKVDGDRVTYFSVEREDWEDIPLDLVDIKKTKDEFESRTEAAKADVKAQAEEDKAERDARHEVDRVPEANGVYLVDGEKITTIPVAESKLVNNKRRSLLKRLSPVPLITGKATLEVDGEHSRNMAPQDRPDFYIRLSEDERFGIVRLRTHKGNRIVEDVETIPVSEEILEQLDQIECFRKQLGERLYKIWPIKPLPPGEYAVIEYTSGKVNTQTWDFAWAPKTN